MLRAGMLRHVVEIQRLVETQNEVGEPVETWTLVARVNASIEALSGGEILRAQQVGAESTVKIVLRYLKGVTPKDRVVFGIGSRVFEINHVADVDERGHELHLLCKEVV